MTQDPDEQSRSFAAQSLAADDPTGWFERLYAAALDGRAIVPWDRDEPNPLLVRWTRALTRRPEPGRSALVVGAGLGRDAEHVESLGYATTAFDISPTAVAGAKSRYPHSTVNYVVADLFDLPGSWHGAYDLVVESMTVQALPDPPRADAIAAVPGLVAPGGTLVVIAFAHSGPEHPVQGPPWPLRRDEIDAFATARLRPVSVEKIRDEAVEDSARWLAEFHRPA